MDCYLYVLMSALVLVMKAGDQLLQAKPLEGGMSASTRDPAATGGVGGGVQGNCVRHLHHRIERCLTRYEQLLVTYRADNTDQEQKDRLRPSFCHQYQVTLQCLHEVLVECPAQPEHLNLIEVRLGYLRKYMLVTCNSPQQNNTPRPTQQPPTHRSTASPSSSTTAEPTSTTARPTTRITTKQPVVKTTTTPRKTLLSSSTPIPGEPDLRDLENNSVKEYTVNYRHIPAAAADATSSLAPPGVKPTSYQKTKLQLLFAQHGSSKMGLSGENFHHHAKGGNDISDKRLVPVMIITEDGTNNAVVQAQMSKQVDCTVDEQGKIDVRCVFSGARGLTWSYLTTLLTIALVLLNTLR